MKWLTRRNIQCPSDVMPVADPQLHRSSSSSSPTRIQAALDGHTFDMRRAEYRHEGDKSTFQVMVARHGLESERRRPESARLDAFIRGLQLSVPDDHQKRLLVRPLYDALYAYCQAKVQALRPYQGAPRLRLWYSQRVATHIEDDHE